MQQTLVITLEQYYQSLQTTFERNT